MTRTDTIVVCTHAGALLALAAVLFLLGGCAAAPTGPAYLAPAAPQAPEPVAASAGSIWAGAQSIALFEDQKARRAGDVLTILLVERTDASKKASTNTSKDSSTEILSPNVFGRPFTVNGTVVGGVGLESSHSFTGGGDSTQSNKLEGSVSVIVARVLGNGNLMVRGEKNLELNQGSERVAIEGIVRPADISPANTVSSDRVADARISYSGSGSLADNNRQGWLARFFGSPWMPF